MFVRFFFVYAVSQFSCRKPELCSVCIRNTSEITRDPIRVPTALVSSDWRWNHWDKADFQRFQACLVLFFLIAWLELNECYFQSVIIEPRANTWLDILCCDPFFTGIKLSLAKDFFVMLQKPEWERMQQRAGSTALARSILCCRSHHSSIFRCWNLWEMPWGTNFQKASWWCFQRECSVPKGWQLLQSCAQRLPLPHLPLRVSLSSSPCSGSRLSRLLR